MRKFVVTCFIFAALASRVYSGCTESPAGTWTPDSLSQSDIQSCVDSCSAGDTISLPSGNSADWTDDVLVSKSIKIIGQGASNTIINTENNSSFHEGAAFTFEIASGELVEVSHFTINGPTTDTYATNGCINLHRYGAVFTDPSFSIHNMRLARLMDRGIMVLDGLYGVIGGVTFVDESSATSYSTQGVSVVGNDATDWGETSNVSFGSAQFVFIEDCLFDYDQAQDGALDAYAGARYVFRHNTVYNTILGHHGKDSGNYHSALAFEVYENQFIEDSGSGLYATFHSRGGSGLIYDNAYTGNFASQIRVSNYCSCKEESSCSTSSWEECRTYPCDEQVGRIMVSGTQTLFPTYEWDNTINSSDVDFYVNELCSEEFTISDTIITIGTDVLNDTEYSYTPYTYPHPLRNMARGGGSAGGAFNF